MHLRTHASMTRMTSHRMRTSRITLPQRASPYIALPYLCIRAHERNSTADDGIAGAGRDCIAYAYLMQELELWVHLCEITPLRGILVNCHDDERDWDGLFVMILHTYVHATLNYCLRKVVM